MNSQTKVAIVTGAGQGIGGATAMLMATEGARSSSPTSTRRPAEQVVDAIRDDGGEATFVRADVVGRR